MENILLEKINREWLQIAVRRMSYQKMRLYHDGLIRGFRDIFGYNQHFSLGRIKNGENIYHTNRQEAEGQEKFILNKFIDTNYINSTVKTLGKEIALNLDSYLAFIKSLPQDWSAYSNSELVENIHHLYDNDRKVEAYYWILFDNIENVAVLATRQVMTRNGHNAKAIEKAFAVISQPTLIIPLDMERLSILKVALCENGAKQETLKKHWEKFAYMPMYDINYDSHDLEYFERELALIEKEITVENIQAEIENINLKYSDRKKQCSDTIKLFNKDAEVAIMLEFLNAFASLKDRKPYVRDQSSYFTKNLFAEAAKRLDISLSEVLFLTKTELDDALIGKLEISKSMLAERITSSAYLFEDEDVYVFTKPDELAIIDSYLATKKDASTELKGVVVSSGKAVGTVAIIISNTDFDKFKEGQILVTSSTRPDFVPLMKKAVAILTDEGGILSHAAIVSRELKVPCIVGLKNATQILEDGDLIEIDAAKGIVKIIK
jgi:phosphohistidine swiveling domain-containing protein